MRRAATKASISDRCVISACVSRESGTGKLEEAVAAYREALKEYTRERVPLDWAMTQMNLGAALRALGERESGTGKLEEAVTALSVKARRSGASERTFLHGRAQELPSARCRQIDASDRWDLRVPEWSGLNRWAFFPYNTNVFYLLRNSWS